MRKKQLLLSVVISRKEGWEWWFMFVKEEKVRVSRSIKETNSNVYIKK